MTKLLLLSLDGTILPRALASLDRSYQLPHFVSGILVDLWAHFSIVCPGFPGLRM